MDKIVCLGKNYLEHAKELGEAAPEKPVIFIKPPSVLVHAAKNQQKLALQLPQARGEVHHECEIVLRLGQNITIEAVTLGLDMTLRDAQSALKKNGHPWTISKVFKDSAVIGPWLKISEFPDWENQIFKLEINGTLKQTANAKEMMLKASDSIDYIRQFFPLCPGDLIFTGTPKGVAPVQVGSVGKLNWGPIEYEVSWS
ncbi:MAG: FAA hydrolase family protein [Proteobacteria bacterium]|nr:FAA hydrolase family protein [Pseudomonadota bacterium]